MKRFAFNLQKALDLRAHKERETEIALGRALAVEAELELRIRTLAAEEHDARSRRFAPGNGIAEIRNWELYITRLENAREDLLRQAAEAALKTQEARARYIEASRERQVLDRLREKRQKEYRKAYLAEEVKTLDDIRTGVRDGE